MVVEKQPVRVIGRYALYDAIASGGMATVHLGRLLGPVGFSRTVAIKRLHPQYATDPEFVSMFLDEARLAARIRHPHVVPTLDVVATEGELFLVMEYIPGESLSRLIRASRAAGEGVPPPIGLALLSGVLQGLHAAHEAKNERGEPLGIVHRDVSPQNILVGSDGQARVLDFGVAKAAGRVQTTREGQLKGKISYMAPEQLGGLPLDRRSDIYSASVVLWETLTGERLFAADNEGAVIARILEGNVEPPSRVLAKANRLPTGIRPMALKRLDEVTLRGLAQEPKDRFDTAHEMALALEECLAPATSANISAWVEKIAKNVLGERAGHVAEIESSSSVGFPSPVAVLAGDAGAAAQADVPTLALGSNPSNPIPSNPSNPIPSNPSNPIPSNPSNPRISSPALASSPSNVAPGFEPSSQLSTVSAVSATGLVGSPRSRRGIWLGVGAAFGAIALLLLILKLTRVPGTATASTVAGSGARSGTSASAAPTLEPAPSTPPPPASAASAEPSASAETPAASASVKPPKPRKIPTSTQALPPPANHCNPPYTWDADGKKHYKPECL